MQNKLIFISKEQLLEMMENQEDFKLVEVLAKEAYENGHLPSAISIPVDEINKLAPKMLGIDEKIVVYCASFECHASTNAARQLLDMGYKNILDYKGGKRDWVSAGLELVKN